MIVNIIYSIKINKKPPSSEIKTHSSKSVKEKMSKKLIDFIFLENVWSKS